MHTHSEIVTIVNKVIETLNEREAGYEIAGEHIRNSELAAMFADSIIQSEQFASELIPYSDQDSPEDIGRGPLGRIFQGWINIKEKISGGSVKSVLKDCQMGEEAAVKVYEAALKDEQLPIDLRKILEKQYGEVKVSEERLKLLSERDFD